MEGSRQSSARTARHMFKLSLPVLFALAAPAFTQTIHEVDAGDDLQGIVNAAADGDVLLFKGGDFEPFSSFGKGLVLINDTGSSISIAAGLGVAGIDINGVPADSEFILRGFSITGSNTMWPFSGFSNGLQITDCEGPVWIEDCHVFGTPTGSTIGVGGSSGGGVVVRDSDNVFIDGCVFEGNNLTSGATSGSAGALDIQSSSVSITDCGLFGGDSAGGGCGPFADCNKSLDAGTALRATSSTVVVSGCTLIGGDGGDALFCTGLNGGQGTDGGDGLTSIGPLAYALLVDNVISAGDAGLGMNGCADGIPGEPIIAAFGAVVESSVQARSLSCPSPVRSGQLTTLSYEGQPGDLVFGLISPSQAFSLEQPYSGALAVDLVNFELYTLGPIGTSGTFAGGIVFPEFVDVPTYRLQALALDSEFVAGLSSPTAVTVLPIGS